MRILISTKSLAKALNQFDFENDRVVRVNNEDNHLIFIGDNQTVKVWCEILHFQASVKQDDRRWDWVKTLMNQVEEQPVALDISEKAVNVIFSY